MGIITNISYAHSKNFKDIKGIAEAKSEIIENIKPGGSIILNEDDKFYKFLKLKAIKKELKIFSFSLKNKRSYTNLIKITKNGNNFKIYLKVGSKIHFYFSNNISKNHLQNLLAAITAISLFFQLNKIPRNIFLDFKIPEGRGDISKLKIKDKVINFVDESYNSNPLSLKVALTNFANMNSKNNNKHVLLGDMLELGKYSSSHHSSMAKIINNLKIDKVHIYGKDIIKTYQVLSDKKPSSKLIKYLVIRSQKPFRKMDCGIVCCLVVSGCFTCLQLLYSDTSCLLGVTQHDGRRGWPERLYRLVHEGKQLVR